MNQLRPLPGISCLTRLTSLSVRNCEGLSDGALSALTRLSGLRILDLSGCHHLTGIGCVTTNTYKVDLKEILLAGDPEKN